MIKVKQMLKFKAIFKLIKCCCLLMLLICFDSCNEKTKNPNTTVIQQQSISSNNSNGSVLKGAPATKIDKNIRSIFQDKNGNYWFGTNAAGVYRYDDGGQYSNSTLSDKEGRLIQYTVKDGLSNNQVQSIQEDLFGNIWFGTGVFGVSRFDGDSFTTFTNKENLRLSNGSDIDWKIEPNDLWFYAGSGVYHYNGNSLVYLPFVKPDFSSKQSQSSPYNLSLYSVYSILKDRNGNVWFGTQGHGVSRYDGKSFTWFTEKGLSGSAVLALFEDSKGNIWFGNNGSGLFRYDGKSLINFTEEKQLSNVEFKVSGKLGPGTLARVYAINEDNYGNLWIGTVDAGVWKYDGNNLTHYTAQDGLTSVAINTIYKDKKGELWFGTDGDGVFNFNGTTFREFVVK